MGAAEDAFLRFHAAGHVRHTPQVPAGDRVVVLTT